MRFSRLFLRTLREAPAGTEVASHGLLVRAGMVHQLGAGIFSLLPLGKKVARRVENIMREEMDRIGGQEMSMPVVNPGEIWKETGRYDQIGEELGRFTDRVGRDMVLAMTHEEAVGAISRDVVQSYRQLPQLIYHIQTKWRDDARPRAGLIRVREFVMKDSYSLDADSAGLDRQYDAHHKAYERIYARCGIPVIPVLADVGMMGGSKSVEFIYVTPIGEDTLLICEACGHRANRQAAAFRKPVPEPEHPLPIEKKATPDTTTIAALAELLGVHESRTAKAVFQVATVIEGDEETERFVFAVVRGDMELSDTKLRNAIGAKELRAATSEEIRAVGAVEGYASPVGLDGVLVAVDDLIPKSPNLVAGANEDGYHLLNTNYGRDYEATIVADLVAADDGDACPECGTPMHTRRGIEVGNIFKLGTHYSEAMGCTYLDADGKQKPIWMGSYGIGSGRLLASIAEEHHDDDGLIWPVTVAPYDVHLVSLGGGEETADELYSTLEAAGLAVLYDDRDESAGVKFNDADLIGVPIRITVSKRSLKSGGVEMKLRREADKKVAALDDVVQDVLETLAALTAEIESR